METSLSPEIIAALVVPFPGQFIEWKPQATTKDNQRALAAAYVDPRRYQQRLDEVVPGQWHTRVEFGGPQGSVVKVSLTICGVTRENVGECDPSNANTVTSAFAQGFKRSCADFGLGRYLYFLPQRWCDYDPQKKQIVSPPPMPAWALPDKPSGPAQTRKNGRTGNKAKGNGKNGRTAVREEKASNPDVPPAAYGIGRGKNEGKTLQGREPRWIEWYAHEMKPTTPERRDTQQMALALLESRAAAPA